MALREIGSGAIAAVPPLLRALAGAGKKDCSYIVSALGVIAAADSGSIAIAVKQLDFDLRAEIARRIAQLGSDAAELVPLFTSAPGTRPLGR